MVQAGAGDTLDLPEENADELAALAKKVSITRVMRSLKTLVKASSGVDETSALPLELAVIESSLDDRTDSTQPSQAKSPQPKVMQSPPNLTPSLDQSQATALEIPQPKHASHTPSLAPQSSPISRPKKDIPNSNPAPVLMDDSQISQDEWNALVTTLSRHKGKRFNMGALLRDCKTPYIANETLILPFSHRSHLERMQNELEGPESRNAMEDILQQVLGSPYTIELTLHADNASDQRQASAASHLVKAATNMGGRIRDERNIDE